MSGAIPIKKKAPRSPTFKVPQTYRKPTRAERADAHRAKMVAKGHKKMAANG